MKTSTRKISTWQTASILITAGGIFAEWQIVNVMSASFWLIIAFAMITKHYRVADTNLKLFKRLFILYHALVAGAIVALPVRAQLQATACQTAGIFGALATFVTTLFGQTADLNSLVCQFIGILTLVLVFGFVAGMAYAGFQIGYQRQPIGTVLDPFFGFVVFVAGTTAIIAILIGTGGTPA